MVSCYSSEDRRLAIGSHGLRCDANVLGEQASRHAQQHQGNRSKRTSVPHPMTDLFLFFFSSFVHFCFLLNRNKPHDILPHPLFYAITPVALTLAH